MGFVARRPVDNKGRLPNRSKQRQERWGEQRFSARWMAPLPVELTANRADRPWAIVANVGAVVVQASIFLMLIVGRTVTTDAEAATFTAWWTLLSSHALLVERVGRELATARSLPLGTYNVLRLLHEAPGGRLRLSDLARAAHLTRSGVTRLANRLERAGMLRRERDTRDRRGSYAALTDRGRDKLKRARAVFVRAVAEHFGSYLNDGEAKMLNAVLNRIVTAETGADYQ